MGHVRQGLERRARLAACTIWPVGSWPSPGQLMSLAGPSYRSRTWWAMIVPASPTGRIDQHAGHSPLSVTAGAGKTCVGPAGRFLGILSPVFVLIVRFNNRRTSCGTLENMNDEPKNVMVVLTTGLARRSLLVANAKGLSRSAWLRQAHRIGVTRRGTT